MNRRLRRLPIVRSWLRRRAYARVLAQDYTAENRLRMWAEYVCLPIRTRRQPRVYNPASLSQRLIDSQKGLRRPHDALANK